MKTRLVSIVAAAVLVLAVVATIAVGSSAQVGSTTQSVSTLDMPGGACGTNSNRVKTCPTK